MAMNLETVLKIKAQVTGSDQINKLSGNMGKLDTNTKKTTTSFGKLKSATSGLTSAFAAIGAGALVTGFGKAAIDSQRLETRIRTLAGPSGEVGQVMDFAAESAERFGIGQNTATAAIADLYGRLRPTGISLEGIKTAFIGVNNAAAQVGLSAADTDGVLLQLSQALGSGTLQGDEFRSVMERLPAVGQALATSLNVPIGALKQMGADGELITQVVLEALKQLVEVQPPPPDVYKQFTAAVENLSIAFGEKLLPAFTPIVQLATDALNVFGQLPGPLQTTIALLGGLGAVLVIIAPLIPAIAALPGALTALGAAFSGGLAAIAGWAAVLPTIGTALSGVGTAITGLVALLTGPVGIAVAVGAAIAGIVIFKDDIGQFFSDLVDMFLDFTSGLDSIFSTPIQDVVSAAVEGIGNAVAPIVDIVTTPFKTALTFVQSNFATPVGSAIEGAVNTVKGAWDKLLPVLKKPYQDAISFVKDKFVSPVASAIKRTVDNVGKVWGDVVKVLQTPITNVIKFISDNWSKLKDTLLGPFEAVVAPIKGALNAVIGTVGKMINGVIDAINGLISGANAIASAVGLPQIAKIGKVNLPKFAEGGMVNGPTVAIVGEAGPEYIVPQGKADGFVENWLAGRRGAAAIPRFAEGGFVSSGAAPNVQINTGPVIQQDGQTYVTTGDLEKALTTFGKSMLQAQRSLGSRRYLGV